MSMMLSFGREFTDWVSYVKGKIEFSDQIKQSFRYRRLSSCELKVPGFGGGGRHDFGQMVDSVSTTHS